MVTEWMSTITSASLMSCPILVGMVGAALRPISTPSTRHQSSEGSRNAESARSSSLLSVVRASLVSARRPIRRSQSNHALDRSPTAAAISNSTISCFPIIPSLPLFPEPSAALSLHLLWQVGGVGVRLDNAPFVELDMKLLGEGSAHGPRPYMEPRPGLISVFDAYLSRRAKDLEQLSPRGYPVLDHLGSRRPKFGTHRDTSGKQ